MDVFKYHSKCNEGSDFGQKGRHFVRKHWKSDFLKSSTIRCIQNLIVLGTPTLRNYVIIPIFKVPKKVEIFFNCDANVKPILR